MSDAPIVAAPNALGEQAPPAAPGPAATDLPSQSPASVEQSAPERGAEAAQVQSTANPEPLSYEPATLPDGFKVDPSRFGTFDKLIGQHQLPPEARQGLVDMFLAEHGAFQDQARQQQIGRFNEARGAWRQQAMSDEALGGAGFQTTIASARRAIDQFVPPEHQAAFDAMLLATGAGDHPALIRLLANIDRRLNPPARVPAPRPPRSRREVLYDNPRSRAGKKGK